MFRSRRVFMLRRWSRRRADTGAKVTEYVRPFDDLRHASLTNGVVAGEQPLEVMTRAGHRSMATTRQYLHLAGVTFPGKRPRSSTTSSAVDLSTHLR
jgi:integrase